MTQEQLSPQALAAMNAMNAATRILEQHNLDMALVERSKGNAGTPHAKRDDKTTGGGLYKWQRDVWDATAKLNMCVYFSIRGLAKGSKYENRLIGRGENVVMATVMAEYLQQTIERMAATWASDQGFQSRFVREAVIYREGMAEKIASRLWTLRYEREEEAKREKEQQTQTGEAGTALVLVDVISNEADLNRDYLNGLEPGTTAKRRAEQAVRTAQWQAEKAIKDEMHRYRLANDPAYAEEHRLLDLAAEKQRARDNAKYKPRAYRETAADRRRSSSAFREGYYAADDISLARQVDQRSAATKKLR